ncbi:MAG TPA: hypothetical protein VFS60_04480 [Thermoanaerobaculia bacterium]|nr:hypothetical protein [Thermoanaerobaculia bacterium]
MAQYQVWRQDDNGREFLVETCATREEAEQQQRDFERHGHKQSYFVIEVTPGDGEAGEPASLGRRVG